MRRAWIAAVAVVVFAPNPVSADDERKARTTITQPRTPRVDNLERRPSSQLPRKERRARIELRDAIKKVWAGKQLKRGTTAIYVVDARTGKELYSVHQDDKLNVASNVKLISTATVLDALGQDWVYTTRIFGAAPDRTGASKGDVYLLGTSDPTIGTGRLGKMVRQVIDTGVVTIEGDVVLSDNVIRDTLGTPHVKVKVKGANRAGQTPTVEYSPKSDFVKLEVNAKTTAKRRARLNVTSKIVTDSDTQEARLVITVAGTIHVNKSESLRRGVGKRSTFTAHTLRQMLIDAGVEVKGRIRIEDFDQYVANAEENGYLPIELASTRSKPIQSLVRRVNKRSLNYLADRLVMTAGAYEKGGRPTMKKAVEAMHDWLESAGVDSRSVVVDTGSGLSYQTQLSVRQIVQILRTGLGFLPHQDAGVLCENSLCYADSLAVGGVDGTLRRRFRSSAIRGNVIGKTGTLTGVIALSGMVQQGEGNELAFAIVTNRSEHGNRWNVRKEHEKIVHAMNAYLEKRAALREEFGAGGPTPADTVQPAPAQ